MRSRFIVVTLALTACAAEPEPVLGSYEGAVISDAVHANGTAGFYWLPPMVSAPSPTGVFAPAASPTVEVLRGTTVIRTLTPSLGADQFHANWDTKADDLDASVTYRVQVRVPGGRVIGFADVDVVDTGAQVKGVDTAQYVALVDGRTLPIKFRIESATIDRDGDGVLDWNDNCPATANADQADSVGDGIGDACRCDTACAATDDCHVATCSPSTGCTIAALPDGTRCTDNGVCEAEQCLPDSDGDSIPDHRDNCRHVPNPDQANSVGDAHGDACRCDFASCEPMTCHDAACDPHVGCVYVPQPDGTVCDTGSSCSAGACTPDRCEAPFTTTASAIGPTEIPRGMRAGDFNGDGIADVVSVEDDKWVRIHSVAGSSTTDAGSFFGVYIAVGDVDNDGKLDVVTTHGITTTHSSIRVLRGNGNGTLQAPIVTPCTRCAGGPTLVSGELGDVNGDGALDLAVGYVDGVLDIMLGNGAGSFAFAQRLDVSSSVGRPVASRFADSDGDGDQDLIIANQDGIRVFANFGGLFGAAAHYTVPDIANYVSSLELADFNRDGDVDLVAGTAVDKGVTVLLGTAGNGFSVATKLFYLGVEVTNVAAGDFDGDGISDVAVTAWNQTAIPVLLGSGDGTLTADASVTLPLASFNAFSAAAADYDGDGDVDLAIGTRSTRYLAVNACE